jgi:hypothetical protein
LFALLLSVNRIACWSQTVVPPSIRPAAIVAGASISITVGSLITSSGPRVISSGVNLLQVDENGNNPTILGALNDNGLDGDLIAGDGIYGGTFLVSSSQPGRIYLRVSAPFEGRLQRMLSPVASVVVVAQGVPTSPRLMNLSRTTVDSQTGATVACDELLFLLQPGVSPTAATTIASSIGGKLGGMIAALGIYQAVLSTCDAGSLSAAQTTLAGNPLVSSVDVDPVVNLTQASLPVNDPLYGNQWSLPKIMAAEGWYVAQSQGLLRQGATIGVLDTGINSKHEDLAVLNDVNQCAGIDSTGQCTSDGTDTSDDYGHGTAVAGLAAAQTNNFIGVASPAYAAVVVAEKIYPPWPNSFSINESSFASAIAQGIVDAIASHARVINISSGWIVSATSATAAGITVISKAIEYAQQQNVLVVVSAGNYNNTFLIYPAILSSGFSNLVAVGATDENDHRALWASSSEPGSNYGPWVTLYAPGSDMYVMDYRQTHGYDSGNGTSFSAPLVAGTASFMLGANPNLTPAQIKTILTETSSDTGNTDVPNGNRIYRLNMFGAVQVAIASYSAGFGTVTVQATLDGSPWTGLINYTVKCGGESINGSGVAMSFTNQTASPCLISHISGGPPNSALNGISPSAAQTLTSGGTITYTLSYASNPPSVAWLSFSEGNPGVPGDGRFVNGGPRTYIGPIPGTYFEPDPPVSLAGITNGVTLTAFPPQRTDLRGIGYGVLSLNPPLGCPVTGWVTGSSMLAGTTIVSAVQGYIFNVSQIDLESQLNILNQTIKRGYPGIPVTCQYTLDEMSLAYLYFGVGANLDFLTSLDALALGSGQNIIPQ